MGFSLKLMPGVRIRLSSSGMGASFGPRLTRVHVGAGRLGLSTGVGPVGFYTSLGGGGLRRSRPGSASAASRAALGATATDAGAPAAGLDELLRGLPKDPARVVLERFLHIFHLHKAEFPLASRPLAEAPVRPDRDSLYRQYEQSAMAGLGMFARRRRQVAREEAAAAADAEAQRRWTAARAQQAEQQRQYDERWAQLCANDPEVVIETLNEAFEDNEVPSAAVGMDGREVTLVVVVAPLREAIPDRMPTKTPGGKLTLKKPTQREQVVNYWGYVSGHIVVTLREAFAVAPELGTARVAVLRHEGTDAYGRADASCIGAVTVDRAALDGIRWTETSAAIILRDAAKERIFRLKRPNSELIPIDLSDQPDLVRLLSAVDVDEMVTHAASSARDA
jgi:Protein of unknown function (DUF4236)